MLLQLLMDLAKNKQEYDKYENDNNMKINFNSTCRMKMKMNSKVHQGNQNVKVNKQQWYQKQIMEYAKWNTF